MIKLWSAMSIELIFYLCGNLCGLLNSCKVRSQYFTFQSIQKRNLAHVTNLVAYRTVEPEHAPVAGMMAAASLITGIFAGINFQVTFDYTIRHF